MELELESTSALILLLFVIPLAFTLSGFLLWILYSLNCLFFIPSAYISLLADKSWCFKLPLPSSELANNDINYRCLRSCIVFFCWQLSLSRSSSSYHHSHSQAVSLKVFDIFMPLSTEVTFDVRVDYAAKSWKIRWWLLDGWLALLYLVAFSAIAFLWRPSANNRR